MVLVDQLSCIRMRKSNTFLHKNFDHKLCLFTFLLQWKPQKLTGSSDFVLRISDKPSLLPFA